MLKEQHDQASLENKTIRDSLFRTTELIKSTRPTDVWEAGRLSEQRQSMDNMILLKIASAGKSEDEESRGSSNDESLFKEL